MKMLKIFLLITLLFGCKKNNKFTEQVFIREKINFFDGTINTGKSDTKQFALSIINHYNFLLDSLVNKNYQKKFPLSQLNNFSIKIILSTSRGSIVVIDTAKENTITTYITNYPAQLYYFTHGQILNSICPLKQILDSFDYSNQFEYGFRSCGDIIFSNSTTNTYFLKIFDLQGFREIVVLKNSYFGITGPNNELIFNKTIQTGFINNDVNFNWVLNRSKDFAERLFNIDLSENFISSELFKKSFLINNYLKKDAEELLNINSRLKKDMNFSYSPEMLCEKTKNFIKKAKEYGFTSEETDVILNYPPYSPRDHYFLFYHKNYKSFMWFWVITNVILLLIIILWIYLFEKKVKKIFKIKWKNVDVIIFGIISFINLKMFYKHLPDYLPFRYFILPFLSYLFLYLLVKWKFLKKKKNTNR